MRTPKVSPMLRMCIKMQHIVLFSLCAIFILSHMLEPAGELRKLVVVPTVSVHFKALVADRQLWKRF